MLCVQCACLHKRLHTLVGSALFHNGWFSSGCLFSMAWAWAEGEILILLCLLLVDTFHFDGGERFPCFTKVFDNFHFESFVAVVTSVLHIFLVSMCHCFMTNQFWECQDFGNTWSGQSYIHLNYANKINCWYIHQFNEGVYYQQLRWRWSEDRERERVLAWSILLSSGRSCCPHTLSPTST